MAFGQNNKSRSTITQTAAIAPASTVLGASEIFRFRSGVITQLQTGVDFTFGATDRWLSLGQVAAGSQTFYGSRFQYDGRAFVTGYSSASPNTPRIEWIHNGSTTAGNLEFRTASSFTSATSTLVASMTPLGNTYFGDISLFNPFGNTATSPKVGVLTNGTTGLDIRNISTVALLNSPTGIFVDIQHNSSNGAAMAAKCGGGQSSVAITGKAQGSQSSIGVQGSASINTLFGAGIYGTGAAGTNVYAGFFDGDILTTAGSFIPSDAKLKQNVVEEANVLNRIALLRPVSYTYKNVNGIVLGQGEQHGFISQELAEVYPELTKDVTKPVFDAEGKIVSELSFKAINYQGLISVLTAGIQELNQELTAVREELSEYKANDNVRSQLMQQSKETLGYSMEQNIPNPFEDRSVIRFQLAPGVTQASITIFDLNGSLIKDYTINQNSGEITILASEIGKGMFIYSLSQNGQEIISKRMIIK